MKTVEEIKSEIAKLNERGALLHVSIKTTRPRIDVTDATVKIIGVYPHMMRVEETADSAACHSIRYTDILIGYVKIREIPV